MRRLTLLPLLLAAALSAEDLDPVAVGKTWMEINGLEVPALGDALLVRDLGSALLTGDTDAVVDIALGLGQDKVLSTIPGLNTIWAAGSLGRDLGEWTRDKVTADSLQELTRRYRDQVGNVTTLRSLMAPGTADFWESVRADGSYRHVLLKVQAEHPAAASDLQEFIVWKTIVDRMQYEDTCAKLALDPSATPTAALEKAKSLYATQLRQQLAAVEKKVGAPRPPPQPKPPISSEPPSALPNVASTPAPSPAGTTQPVTTPPPLTALPPPVSSPDRPKPNSAAPTSPQSRAPLLLIVSPQNAEFGYHTFTVKLVNTDSVARDVRLEISALGLDFVLGGSINGLIAPSRCRSTSLIVMEPADPGTAIAGNVVLRALTQGKAVAETAIPIPFTRKQDEESTMQIISVTVGGEGLGNTKPLDPNSGAPGGIIDSPTIKPNPIFDEPEDTTPPADKARPPKPTGTL